MKRLFGSMILVTLLAPRAGAYTFDGTNWVNDGDITFPPQIDATNVINNGTFDFTANTTELPFDTSNTRNFTNNGTMIGSVGFRFDNAPSTGPRKPSANFRNRLQGRITAVDGATPSYLLVSATNIINEGVLTGGGAGKLQLAGTNVKLARSGVQIRPITPRGSHLVSTNIFSPEVAIYDNYWGQTNQVMDSGNIIQVSGAITNVTSPLSQVGFPFNFTGVRDIQLVNPYGQFYTNTLVFTNLSLTNSSGLVTITPAPVINSVQAVFVGLPPTSTVSADVRFSDGTSTGKPKTVSVGVTMTSTNVVSGGPELTSIYLVDTLASEANRGFYNNVTDFKTFRPQNYRLERTVPSEFLVGSLGNANFAPDLLYKTNFPNRTVTNEYAAYSAFIDNIASRPPNIPAGTVTNLPGRVEIFADNLDMFRTRFRADGLLNINAKHLINSSNAAIDCENLNYNLGSTNGNLKIQSLAQESVARLKGNLYVWSGLWTNRTTMFFENWDVVFPAERKDVAVVVEVIFHTMILDAGQLLTQLPVVVNALVTHSTNVVVNDRMTVVQSFLIDGGTNGDGQSFTLNGGITFSNTFFIDTAGNTVVVSLEDWVGTNAPSLRFFTNNGTLKIPNQAHFGDDRPLPYAAFVNRGTIDAFGQAINSDYCELAGNNVTTADLKIITRSGKVEGGTLNSGRDIQFHAGDLKFSQSTMQAGSRLDLTVTNSLFDSGGGAGNSFSCRDGFRLLVKPQTGDLLGTAFNTIAPDFASVSHAWAGLNLGASKAGFVNNVALGRLVPIMVGEGGYPSFVFSGTDADNGLYVDDLDLSQVTDYANQLQIDDNLIIYYAAAQLNFIPPGGQSPEEFLNGQFDGRLRWVPDFAGPNSSVDVVINGNQTIQVNQALRNSTVIDSDSDGIPNFYDPSPFDGVQIESIARNPSPVGFLLSWDAAANTVYQVEYKTNLTVGAWTLLLTTTNTASVTTNLTALDTNVVSGSAQRYYRVIYSPNGP